MQFLQGNTNHARDLATNRNVKLFNPRQQKWTRHFAWAGGGVYITGLTASGRATVLALQLNNLYAVAVGQAWISAGGIHQLKILKISESNLGWCSRRVTKPVWLTRQSLQNRSHSPVAPVLEPVDRVGVEFAQLGT